MLLNDLTTLHSKLIAENRLTPVGYQRKPVRFIVGLDKDGNCTSVDDAGPRGTLRAVPEIKRTSKPMPFISCDKGEYVLGVAKTQSAKDDAHARKVHNAYLERLRDAADALTGTDDATADKLRAVAAFTENRDSAIQEFLIRGITFEPNPQGVVREANDRITFRFSDGASGDGVDPIDQPAVRNWWAGIANADLSAGKDVTCQVEGTAGELARKMPGITVMKGTPQLISANFSPAERYNATQSTGAQVSVAAAVRSHQALNWLLSDSHHNHRIGEIYYAWWLDSDIEFDPFNRIAQPDPGDVESMLAQPFTGRPGVSPSDQFRLLALSLNEGRIAVRLNHVSTLADVEARIRRWLEFIVQRRKDGSRWWPAIGELAQSAVPPGAGNARKAQKDRIIETLANAAIAGRPLPRSLLAALVDRCRAVPVPRTPNGKSTDFDALGSRLAALNLYRNLKEANMTQTETAAGLCGRLLAQLDYAQYKALGTTNRSVVDRFYGAASTRPQNVFPSLMKTNHAHLSSLGRQQSGRGAQVGISRRIGELSQQLITAGGFPPTLNLEQQAEFALAYWDERHQRFSPATTGSDDNTEEEKK